MAVCFRFVLAHLPGNIGTAEIEDMIATVDKNQDGKISYSEFRVRWTGLLSRACCVPVGRRSGGRLATTLVATKNDIILFSFFFSFLFSDNFEIFYLFFYLKSLKIGNFLKFGSAVFAKIPTFIVVKYFEIKFGC